MKFSKYLNLIVEAEKEVAYDSPDHLNPLGTSRDNSVNKRFNQKVYVIFKDIPKPLKVLDMGCSGGGFVKSCIDDGCIAVGLEGSDYSKILKRAEWKSIPDKLFTCDITAPFQIKIDNGGEVSPLQLDLVTCWEVIEHIREDDIQHIAKNVAKHLLPHGLWIMSVALEDDWHNGINLHQTVKPKNWWVNKFKELGFTHLPEFDKYFNEQYIRGNRYGATNSFHLVLSKDPSKAPRVPEYKLPAKIYDRWKGSTLQRFLTADL